MVHINKKIDNVKPPEVILPSIAPSSQDPSSLLIATTCTSLSVTLTDVKQTSLSPANTISLKVTSASPDQIEKDWAAVLELLAKIGYSSNPDDINVLFDKLMALLTESAGDPNALAKINAALAQFGKVIAPGNPPQSLAQKLITMITYYYFYSQDPKGDAGKSPKDTNTYQKLQSLLAQLQASDPTHSNSFVSDLVTEIQKELDTFALQPKEDNWFTQHYDFATNKARYSYDGKTFIEIDPANWKLYAKNDIGHFFQAWGKDIGTICFQAFSSIVNYATDQGGTGGVSFLINGFCEFSRTILNDALGSTTDFSNTLQTIINQVNTLMAYFKGGSSVVSPITPADWTKDLDPSKFSDHTQDLNNIWNLCLLLKSIKDGVDSSPQMAPWAQMIDTSIEKIFETPITFTGLDGKTYTVTLPSDYKGKKPPTLGDLIDYCIPNVGPYEKAPIMDPSKAAILVAAFYIIQPDSTVTDPRIKNATAWNNLINNIGTLTNISGISQSLQIQIQGINTQIQQITSMQENFIQMFTQLMKQVTAGQKSQG